jgi:cobalt-zinc-cadmium efflux system outer membrane protein
VKKQLFLALALIASACVSVPRDAGTSDVRQAVAERTNLDSQETGELTADKAVAVAMANNPRLQATLAELGIARADLMQASIVRNPLFEAELRFPRDPVRPFELRLAQTLVDLIQLRRRRAAGRAAFDTAKLRVTSEVIRFAAGVREQHTELIAASQRVAQSRMNLAAAQAAVELAQRQHDAQNITDLDLENQQTQYEQAKVDLAREEQRLLVAREALLRSMALRDPAIDEHLPSDFPSLPASELDQQQLEQLAAARRLDIDIARREADLAKQRISLARLAALGDVTADVH